MEAGDVSLIIYYVRLCPFLSEKLLFNVMKYIKKGSHTHTSIINTNPLVSLIILVSLVIITRISA